MPGCKRSERGKPSQYTDPLAAECKGGEGDVGEGVNLQSRWALLKQFAPQYRMAPSAHKRMLLDAFVQATGYHRRYGV